ncbi:MAG: accessory gene regulator B family protein [Clostridiales bacterium]|nr:accessory gene regulator B family protein [Clostridiales bacterium]MBP5416522.1 accessory gene regulator B family protein [Clostridiales bacterium]
MIENTCNKIVGRMITNGIISADECAIYSYHIQVMLEAIVGHVIILTAAFILGYFVEVLLFLFSFGVLRGSTSGYHCKTSVGCVLLSSLSCAIVVGLQNFALSHILYYQGGVDNINDYYNPRWRYQSPGYGMVRRRTESSSEVCTN